MLFRSQRGNLRPLNLWPLNWDLVDLVLTGGHRSWGMVVVIGTLWGHIKKFTILMWCLVIAVVDIEVGGDK